MNRIPATLGDDTRELAGFGYRQELDRTLGRFSPFPAAFSCISILTGVFQTLYLGFGAGGRVFIWKLVGSPFLGWIVGWIMTAVLIVSAALVRYARRRRSVAPNACRPVAGS